MFFNNKPNIQIAITHHKKKLKYNNFGNCQITFFNNACKQRNASKKTWEHYFASDLL